MFDGLTDKDISTAIDELVNCLGIREEAANDDLVQLVRRRDIERCLQLIAERLGLPIRIVLNIVPKGFDLGRSDRFETSALARADKTGHHREGILAQVMVPCDLPMFGSSALRGYPIRVRVSENCYEHPHTFVAVMAHELSHVLLSSLRHPQEDSELHADLVPLVLGFGEVVRKGRRRVRVTESSRETVTEVFTYGYLTDEQFDFACRRIRRTLQRYREQRDALTSLLDASRRKFRAVVRLRQEFGALLRYLDKRPPRRMNPRDALRIVEFHAHDHTYDWDTAIARVRAGLREAEDYVESLGRDARAFFNQLEGQAKALTAAMQSLDRVAESIAEDVAVLRRHVPLLDRLTARAGASVSCCSANRASRFDKGAMKS